MTLKIVEVIAVVAASIVAAIASVIGLLTLWEIKEQSANSEQQLIQIEKQSELLGKQIGINEQLISNDSALTFLQLLETMRPEWSVGEFETAIGGQVGYERFNNDTFLVKFEVTNEGRLPLVISEYVTVSMVSCITGQSIDISGEGSAGGERLEAKLLNRASTIPPGETDTIWFYKDIVEAPKMAQAIRGTNGEYFLEFSALAFAEGAETVGAYLDDSDGLASYFQVIRIDDRETRAPFLSKKMYFQSWILSKGNDVRHSNSTESCTTDQLKERFSRSNN